MKIAVLDDYQGHSLELADWSQLPPGSSVTVFREHLRTAEEAARVLAPFDIICLLRERMAVPRELIEQLPNLKFIAATGPHNRTIDFRAAAERGIVISHTSATGPVSHDTIEITWALILNVARHIAVENDAMRRGEWQTTLGTLLNGKVLGLLGLGRLGSEVGRIGRAFGMDVIAWSENLTEERARQANVRKVARDELFRLADFLSIHLVLGDRSRGIVGSNEFSLMKKTAYLINTSRGAIVREDDLLEALDSKMIAGAALDVYEHEPLPREHRLRSTSGTLLTPHLGYVTRETLSGFYGDTVENICAFLKGTPIRPLGLAPQSA